MRELQSITLDRSDIINPVLMKPEDIKWGDWNRILFGESPPAYLLEVVVRVAIIYILILIAMRSLGKRMTAEVSRAELVARVSIAAAVGLPIQRPARGLLGAAIVAIIVVFVGRWLAALAVKSVRFEKVYQGYYATLVSDGVLDRQRMKKIRITQERLFAGLRSEGVRHLGQVKRFYMEANGEFSLVCAENEQPGLSVIPEWDAEMRQRHQQTDVLLCKGCGQARKEKPGACSHCGGGETEIGVLVKGRES